MFQKLQYNCPWLIHISKGESVIGQFLSENKIFNFVHKRLSKISSRRTVPSNSQRDNHLTAQLNRRLRVKTRQIKHQITHVIYITSTKT